MYLLLVDSELFNTADFKEMLKHAPSGSDIVSTYSTDSLLRVAGKISPDIIIVDFDLIDDEASDIFNNLRSLSEKAHIIALTEADQYDKLFEAIEHAGVDDYIVKPIRKEELVARVQIASKRKPLPAIDYETPTEEHVAPGAEYSVPKIDEKPFKDDPIPLKEDLEEAAGFSFDDDEEAVIEPGSEGKKARAEDPYFTDLSENAERDVSTAQDLSTEKEEFIIYDDPDMTDMFEPDKPQFETKAEDQDDPFDINETADTIDATDDSKIRYEKEYSFDDIEAEGDFQPKPIVQPGAETQEDKQDFDFFDDFSDDETSTTVTEEKTTGESIDSLFEDEEFSTKPLSRETENEILSKDLDFGQDKALQEFEVTIPDEEDPWDFGSYEEEKINKNVPGEADVKSAPAAKLFDEEGLFSDQEKPAPAAADIKDSESYFDDLFAEDPPKTETAAAADEDDFFGPNAINQSAVERKPIKPNSDLPGKTADDFLFGESAFDDDSSDKEYRTSMLDEFSFDDDADEKPKKKGMKAPLKNKGPGGGFSKFISIFGNVVFVALLLMMATLSFFLIQSRITGGVPQVAGYQMYIVLSGSMAPEFDTGSLAFVKETPPELIVVGDIITYRTQAGSDSLTTHRVVEVNRQDGLQFTTRGDANNVNDPNPVLAENVVGRVTGSIPYLGYLLNFVQTRQGLILLIFVPGVLIIVYELGKIMKYLTESRREETA